MSDAAIRPRTNSRFDVLPDLRPDVGTEALGAHTWSTLYHAPASYDVDEVALAARLFRHVDGMLTMPVDGDGTAAAAPPDEEPIPEVRALTRAIAPAPQRLTAGAPPADAVRVAADTPASSAMDARADVAVVASANHGGRSTSSDISEIAPAPVPWQPTLRDVEPSPSVNVPHAQPMHRLTSGEADASVADDATDAQLSPTTDARADVSEVSPATDARADVTVVAPADHAGLSASSDVSEIVPAPVAQQTTLRGVEAAPSVETPHSQPMQRLTSGQVDVSVATDTAASPATGARADVPSVAPATRTAPAAMQRLTSSAEVAAIASGADAGPSMSADVSEIVPAPVPPQKTSRGVERSPSVEVPTSQPMQQLTSGEADVSVATDTSASPATGARADVPAVASPAHTDPSAISDVSEVVPAVASPARVTDVEPTPSADALRAQPMQRLTSRAEVAAIASGADAGPSMSADVSEIVPAPVPPQTTSRGVERSPSVEVPRRNRCSG